MPSSLLVWACCLQIAAGAGEVPSAEQLVSLVRATRDRYASVDVEFHKTSYRIVPEGDRPAPYLEQDFVWRKSEDRVFAQRRGFSETSQAIKSAGTKQESVTAVYEVVTALDTPKWSKVLRQWPGDVSRAPRGTVQDGHPAKNIDITPVHAMWGLFDESVYDFSSEGFSNARVIVEDDGLLSLDATSSGGGRRISVTVDPALGFLPVRSKLAISTSTHSLTIVTECSDFRKVSENLWFPFQYSKSSDDGYRFEYSVRRVAVNEAIPDAKLSLEFPPKTIVQDQLSKIRYKIRY